MTHNCFSLSSGVPGKVHDRAVVWRVGGQREGDDGRAAARAPPHRLCHRRVQGRRAERHEARQEPQITGIIQISQFLVTKYYIKDIL